MMKSYGSGYGDPEKDSAFAGESETNPPIAGSF